MKYQLSVIALFLLAVSGLAVGQGVLPTPQIVDHQIVTSVGHTSFTATENIASAYNIVIISVTCNWYTGVSRIPCAAATYPVDQNNVEFTLVERHYNDTKRWTQEEYYAIIANTGSDVITFDTAYTCSTCTWNALVEQVQGIGADD